MKKLSAKTGIKPITLHICALYSVNKLTCPVVNHRMVMAFTWIFTNLFGD